MYNQLYIQGDGPLTNEVCTFKTNGAFWFIGLTLWGRSH